jgi:isopenicillin N synthase-like dioxygenase
MATITADSVASVSLNDADREPDTFADRLGRSFEEYGFAIIADHGIPDELIHDAEEKAKAFFALPDEVKRKHHIAGGGGARGYTPFGIETAKGAQAFDLKEFWHVGRELAAGHPFRDHMGDNVWPEEVPGFKDTFLKLFDTFDRTGLKILKAIARFLKIDEDYFIDTVRDGNSVLRLLHYPPIQGEPGSNVRACAHEDNNTIT